MPKRGKGQSRKSPGNKNKRQPDPIKMGRALLASAQQPVDSNSPEALRALHAEQQRERDREASSQTPQRHSTGLVVPRPNRQRGERSEG